MFLSVARGRRPGGVDLRRLRSATSFASARPRIHSLPNRGMSQLATAKLEHSSISPGRSNPAPSGLGPGDVISNKSLNRDEFWRKVPLWKDVSAEEFLSYRWSVKHIVEGENLRKFLAGVVPERVPYGKDSNLMQDRDALIGDVLAGVSKANMAVRMTPYVLSRVNWSDPRNDPVCRQFIPLRSNMLPDRPELKQDPLGEGQDSPVEGIVHRYPDKVLFLPISVCPTYCLFCTRSYAVGPDTDTVEKASYKPSKKRWEVCLDYIRSQPGVHDVVVSGGDAFYLQPHQLAYIGDQLIAMDNVRRFRIASKGLAVAPNRFLDPADDWTGTLIELSDKARRAGKAMALHTHFGHPNEISWITELSSRRLMEAGVTVRNQTVLLRGVNDNAETMSTLIRRLADMNIIPYYVYQMDMVKNCEHLRTPLSTILDLEAKIRGSIAGFMTPQFVVDLPGGGGKRLACSYESYDRATGVSTFRAPAVTDAAASHKNNNGGAGGGVDDNDEEQKKVMKKEKKQKPEVFRYYDPILPESEEVVGKPEGC